MALLFCDSFDHYGSGYTPRKWSASRNGSIDLTTGRFGQGWYGANSRWTSKTLATGYTSLIVGMAIQPPTGNENTQFFGFLEQASSSTHVFLWYDFSAHVLKVGRGATVLGSYAWSPVAGAWYYLEAKVVVSDTVGSIEVRIDGVTVINVTGVDTKDGGTGVIDRISLGRADAGDQTNTNIDDFVLLDTSGSSPTNDFLGDVRVEALFPSGNGNSSQLDGSDGNSTDNYLLVDEAYPWDDDTTYVESGDVGDKDTYAMTNLTPTAGTVFGVQVIPLARKTDAGARSIKSVARLSTTEVDSADKVLSTTYQYLPDIRETKPGGGAWTITDVNAAEFGVKVSA